MCLYGTYLSKTNIKAVTKTVPFKRNSKRVRDGGSRIKVVFWGISLSSCRAEHLW